MNTPSRHNDISFTRTDSSSIDHAATMQQVNTLLGMSNIMVPAVIRAAMELNLHNILQKPHLYSQLVKKYNFHPETLLLLLDAMCEIGLMVSHDSTYELSPLGKKLPLIQSHVLSSSLLGAAHLSLFQLDHTIRTGELPFTARHDDTYWETVNSEEKYLSHLIAGSCELDRDGEIIIHNYDWSHSHRVADLGGHTGNFPMALAKAYPHLTIIMIELENCVIAAQKRFHKYGVNKQCSAMVGSFFDPWPEDCDTYLLSSILGDWDDENALKILRQGAQALKNGAKLVVADTRLRGNSSLERLYFRSLMPSPFREPDQIIELAQQAGMYLSWRGKDTGMRSLLEFKVA